MITHKMEQGTPEWFAVKCGKISASNMSAVMAKGKGKTRMTYMRRLLAERLSNIPQETYTSGAMDRGVETEPQARMAYEELNLVVVEQVGFIEVDEWFGCSPDGLVGDDGLVEIKCPNTATHVGYVLDDKMPTDYALQVQTQMLVTERKWVDFVSFDPRVPSIPIFQVRVDRDESKIQQIKDAVDDFVAELKELMAKFTGDLK